MEKALARALGAVAVLTVATSLLVLLAGGVLLLRGYARENIELVAQQAAWTAEVAVVFNDDRAAADAVRPLLRSRGVTAVTVRDSGGRTMASVAVNDSNGYGLAAALIDPDAVSRPILLGGQRVGDVTVEGRTTGVGTLMLAAILGALAALALGWLATGIQRRRLRRSIIAPLQGVAAAAHGVRQRDGLAGRAPRAPSASVTEVDDLARDFNALIDELELRQSRVEEAHKQLLHRANFDPLSGLPNRSSFIDRIGGAIRAARRSGESFAVLFMDGDGFKETNDRFGHAAGDVAIEAIAARIVPLLRGGDMAARLGGDEFGVLVRNLESPDDADAVASRISEAMLQPIHLPGDGRVVIGLSIGIAIYPDDGDQVDALIDRADSAMYAAKHARKAAADGSKRPPSHTTG